MKKEDYTSIISLEYWHTAFSELRNLRTITFAGIIISLSIAIDSFYIPVSESLHISLTFIPFSIGAIVFGPIVGLFSGMIFDILNFAIHPSGVFFPGYAISSMLELFIYGIFLYNCRLTILRIFMAKLITNYGIHVFLGSLWNKILFNKGFIYFFAKSLIKNTIMLPIEVFACVLLLQILFPILTTTGSLKNQNSRTIPFI